MNILFIKLFFEGFMVSESVRIRALSIIIIKWEPYKNYYDYIFNKYIVVSIF